MSQELDPTQEQVLSGPTSNSIMTIRLGGQDYPLENHARCHVCQSPWRMQIERAIISGRVYSKIAKALPTDENISAGAIKRHASTHMVEGQAHLRQVLDTRAARLGKSIEEGEDLLVDGLALAEAVVQKTYEAVADGSLRPKLIDGLRAAKLLEDYSAAPGDNRDDMAEAFVQYMDEAAKTMDPVQFAQFNARLEANPVLRALIEKAEQQQVQQAEEF